MSFAVNQHRSFGWRARLLRDYSEVILDFVLTNVEGKSANHSKIEQTAQAFFVLLFENAFDGLSVDLTSRVHLSFFRLGVQPAPLTKLHLERDDTTRR